jgi:3-hydroxyisobutyrate dehydrogenase-like beta-hydroxyacid dehydrogenase
MDTVGVIGLGAMGAPMAWNVAESEYDLAVYNRTTERTVEFAEAGIKVTDSPRHLTEQADVVVIMVTDGDAVQEVLERKLGVLAGVDGDTTVVQMSTISNAETLAAAEAVRDAGGRFVDAPVLGTIGPAEEGTLSIFASGDRDIVDSTMDIFEVFGDSIFYVGEVGQGTNLKLTTNLLLGNMMGAFAEALTFGVAHGLEARKVIDAIQSGPIATPLFDAKGQSIQDRDFEPHFPVEKQHKDLTLALSAGGEAGVTLPQTAAARETFSAAMARGYAENDMSAVVRHLEETAGVEVVSDD